ncbi:MAG: tetratricopeptide repeat protein [Cyanobacteria bacterium P01_D01_bin.115]
MSAQESSDQRHVEADQLLNQGIEQFNSGQTQQALETFQRELELRRQLGDREGEWRSLGWIGLIYQRFGQYQPALELYQDGLSIALDISDRRGEGVMLNNIGRIYDSLGEYQEALSYYERSLAIRQDIGNRRGEGVMLNNIGFIYSRLGEYQEALGYYERSLAILQDIGNRQGEGESLNNIGFIYSRLGEYQEALGYYERSLAIRQDIGDRQGEGQMLNNIGFIYSRLGEYQEALGYYERSLAIRQDIGDRRGEAITLMNIGRILDQQGQPEMAIVFLKQSVNVREDIRQGIQDLSSDLQQSYTNTVADDYRFLADLLIAEGRFLEALQVLELLKAEEIREYTRGTVTNVQTGEIQLSPAEAEVADTLKDLLELGLHIEACEQRIRNCTFEELEGFYEDRQALTKVYNDLTATLELNDQTNPPNPGDLITEGVAEVLEAQPNTGLIYPVVLEDRLVLLWATRGGVANAIEVPQVTEADINQAAFEFRRLMRQCERAGCTSDDIPAIQAVVQQLHQWLIPQDLDDLFQQAGIENLVFALDQQLRYIPMAALHNGEQYLIERYTFSTVTAAWLTPTANPLPPNPTEVSILGLGLSQEVFDDDPNDDIPYFGPLHHVPTELDGIIRRPGDDDPNGVYPGLDLLNQDFDESAFYRLKIDGHQILHIATHGVFVPTNLYSSYLMLGTREDWRISEMQNIGQHFTDLSLVVLSACETALGGDQQSAADAEALDGREISGIAQTFLDAGADAIIASLWKVSDGSTSALMQQFYIELAKGTEANPVTFSAALRQAQVSLLTGDVDPAVAETLRSIVEWGDRPDLPEGEAADTIPDLSHPFYWAPFTLIGNGL